MPQLICLKGIKGPIHGSLYVQSLVCTRAQAGKGQVQMSLLRIRLPVVNYGEPGAHTVGWVGWPGSPKALPLSTSPALGIQACAATPGFVWVLGLNSDPPFLMERCFIN